MEEQYPKQALDKFRQWHFWWLVVFSLFLIITFIYYLPTKFLNQLAGDNYMMEDMHREMDNHANDESMKEHMNAEMTEEGMMYEESDVKNGLVVNLNISPASYVAGGLLKLDFSVNMKPGNTLVSGQDLQIEHEKPMHIIGVRSDLSEFLHLHPALSDNIFSVDHIFVKPGVYKIWSEIKKDNVIYIFGHSEISVAGEGLISEKNVSFGRNVIAEDYQVSLETDMPLIKNRENKLYFDIHDLLGNEINVEDYLGARMHLTIVKDDLKQIIHTHPKHGLEDSHDHSFKVINRAKAHGGVEDEHQVEEEVIGFSVNFTESGLYKAFAQFRPKGTNLPEDKALLAEFWLQVEEKAPSVVSPVSPWWGLLIASAVLIVILGLAVNKFIRVKKD